MSKNLEVPDNFEFPFIPYDIQQEFMQRLYYVLENNKLGIFESPTGTGKSLSIICGSIKWLKDRQQFERSKLFDRISQLENEKHILASEVKDWLSAQSKEIEITRELNNLTINGKKIIEYEKKIQDIQSLKNENAFSRKFKKILARKHMQQNRSNAELEEIDEDDLLPEEESRTVEETDSEEEIENKYEPLKPNSLSVSSIRQGNIKVTFADNVRVTSLASRQTYCINPSVSKLKNVSLINERCLDIQKNVSGKTKTDSDGKAIKRQKGSTTCSCPYYKQNTIDDLRHTALIQILDVEDLVDIGKELNACPYYASRKAAEDAEVILIPYNTLLHKPTREANGIKLKNNVVIIDEAHNLLEALAQMHNVEIGYPHLHHSLSQMKSYKNTFRTRLSAKNLLLINQLIYVLNQLLQMLDKAVERETTEIFKVENFVLTAGIDNYNMFKICKFCKDTRMAQKIRNYAIKYPVRDVSEKPQKKGVKDFLASIENKNKVIEKEKPEVEIPKVGNPLLGVLSLLETLTYSYEDGRILMKKFTDKVQNKLQFLLLNPSSHFVEIVKEARSIIVAGGTMKPIAEFRDRLFINAGAYPERIVEFSCDHIVPPENILPIIVTKGPNNERLLFNFENRMSMGFHVKNVILEACKNVKGGIVVFFPSYKYESWIWQMIKDVDFGRAVFREPQNSASVDSVLEQYSEAIKKCSSRGALLLSVVGGKLSEGLNFSDDLGRCVVVVGLPYANIMAADLKEKMNYLDKTEGSGSGQKFYENQCIKAVNQCIGRAVRHKDDYATVLLLDERYNRTNVKNSLPNWIKKSLKVGSYSESFSWIKEFFDEKKYME